MLRSHFLTVILAVTILFLLNTGAGMTNANTVTLSILPPSLNNQTTSTAPVSYNPLAGNRFHAPLSSMGLIGVTHASPSLAVSLKQMANPLTDPSNSVPINALRFITDQSYMPQSETSIAIDPSNSKHIVGGFNDARDFFCTILPVSECPSGWTASISGFSISADGGATLLKSSDLPGINYTLTGSSTKSYLYPWGDPSVTSGISGNFYYASLAIDPVKNTTGIMISESNSSLWDPSVSCASALHTPGRNSCWKSAFVYGNLTLNANSFEDKDWIAVDRNITSPYYGAAYIIWDHFFPDGTSASYLARCSSNLICVMLSGGGRPILSGTDKFAANAVVVVDRNSVVYLAWCNYGTAKTFGPVSCKIRSSPAGGSSFGVATEILSYMGLGTTLPNDNAILGFATEQFRAGSIPTLAVDLSGKSNNLYFALPVCISGRYYPFNISSDNPGSCGTSSILFTRSTTGGTTWSTPTTLSTPAVNIQPYVAVDSITGRVFLVYYTARFDPFDHRIDVVAEVSSDAGNSFPGEIRVTSVSNEPDADPNLFNYISPFGGSFSVPQYGDYFEAFAQGNILQALFTGNYAAMQGTLQTDPFLATITNSTAPSSLSATRSAGKVTLTWNPPYNLGGTGTVTYNIYRGTAPAAATLLATTQNQTAYIDTAVNNGTSYYYEVTANNGMGESFPSNEVNVPAVLALGATSPTNPLLIVFLLVAAVVVPTAVLALKLRKNRKETAMKTGGLPTPSSISSAS